MMYFVDIIMYSDNGINILAHRYLASKKGQGQFPPYPLECMALNNALPQKTFPCTSNSHYNVYNVTFHSNYNVCQ